MGQEKENKMNLKTNFSSSLAIITEQDLSDVLNYKRSEDISDEDMTSALVCATVRVDELSGGVIISQLQTLTQETQQKVKIATCLLAQYYLKGGYSWLRGSTSLNAGQISVSQAFPDEPDYVLPQIKILLQITEENLYKPTYSYQNKYSDKGYDLNLIDWYPESNITWQQADRMFLRPNNIKSSDKSVDIKFSQPITGEPIVDLKVSIKDVNKYKGDEETVIINEKNVVSAYALKENEVVISATKINNELAQKATKGDLENKIDKDFKNSDLQDLISNDYHNAITLSVNDKKLYVGYKDLPNTPGTYYGDNSSIIINNKNVISAYGVHYENDKGKDDVITGDAINTNLTNFLNELNNVNDKVEKNSESITDIDKKADNNTQQIGILKNAVDVNKSLIDDRVKYEEVDESSIVKAASSKKYYCYALSKPNSQQYWNIDDINQIIDDKIKDAISKIVFPKWKIVLKPEDFKWQNNKMVYNYTFKNNSLYRFVSGDDISSLVRLNYIFSYPVDYSVFLRIFNNVLIYYMNIRNHDLTCEYIDITTTRKNPVDLSQNHFYLLELENATEPIPTPAPPILNKTEEFNYIKHFFKHKEGW